MATKAQFCTECGAALSSTQKCTNPDCKNYMPIEDTTTDTASGYSFSFMGKAKSAFIERNKKLVPDIINSDQDEVHIRQYDIARLQSLIIGAFAEGVMQITNKRVLFRSSGFSLLGKNSLQYEFALEEISGIEFRKEARFNPFTALLLTVITWCVYLMFTPLFSPMHSSKFLSFIFSALMAFGSGLAFILLKKHKYWSHTVLSVCTFGLLAGGHILEFLAGRASVFTSLFYIIVLGLLLINAVLLVFSPNLVIAVKTKGGTPSIEIRKKDGFFSKRKNEYTGFSQVMPGPDVDIAMKEVGAIIRQVQQTGTYEV